MSTPIETSSEFPFPTSVLLVQAIEVAQIMDQSLDEGNSKMVLQCIEIAKSQLSSYIELKKQSVPLESEAPFLQCFSAAWVNSKVVLLGVSFHEQERRYIFEFSAASYSKSYVYITHMLERRQFTHHRLFSSVVLDLLKDEEDCHS